MPKLWEHERLQLDIGRQDSFPGTDRLGNADGSTLGRCAGVTFRWCHLPLVSPSRVEVGSGSGDPVVEGDSVVSLEPGSVVVDAGTVVSIGSSGSVITGSVGSLVDVVSGGMVVAGALEVLVSTGSSGSVMVVTEPDVDASVVGGADDDDEDPGSPGMVVVGKLAVPSTSLSPTGHVGAAPGALGISRSGWDDSSTNSSVPSATSVLSTLTGSPRVGSVSGVAEDSTGGSVAAGGRVEVMAGGAVSGGASSTWVSVEGSVLGGGGSVETTEVTPATVGTLGVTVPTRISFF